jgi:hypothetical protein
LDEGKNIPDPVNIHELEYSGKFTLRLPKSLHRELALRAEEGVSLNQFILYFISKELNNKETSATKESDNEMFKHHIESQLVDPPYPLEEFHEDE